MKLKPSIIIFSLLCVTLFLSCQDKDAQLAVEKIQPHTLNINFEGEIPNDEKIKMTLDVSSLEENSTYKGKIETRGGFSISFPKKSYEIDLKKDVPLAGLTDDDDWILNSNYIDKTFLRHVISYQLFTDMSDNNIASECRYVEVGLNGKYNGLYVLMEKLDKSSLEIDDSDSLSFIFKEPHIFRETYEGIKPQNANNFHQQTFPKIRSEDKRSVIEAIRDSILVSSDDDFKTYFNIAFDVDNIIDWHLLLLISNNGDGILKNFYLFKSNTDTPIRVAPWDYDHSFGRDGDNELNLDQNPLKIERSILFKRLLQFDWYKTALKKRWNQLNEANILSTSGLKNRILQKSTSIRDLANKNFELWPLGSKKYYDDNDFDEEIDIMIQFIDIRHQRLSKYFSGL